MGNVYAYNKKKMETRRTVRGESHFPPVLSSFSPAADIQQGASPFLAASPRLSSCASVIVSALYVLAAPRRVASPSGVHSPMV